MTLLFKSFNIQGTCKAGLKKYSITFSGIKTLKMSQKTIASYFQKSSPIVNGTKRSSIDAENVDKSNILPDKKLKTEPNLLSDQSPRTTDSPSKQDNDLIEEVKDNSCPINVDKAKASAPSNNLNRSKLSENENKLKAELKLLCKTLPALHPNVGLTWFQALRNEFGKPYFKKLSSFLKEERLDTTPILPIPENVWTWTRECRVDEVKVVIIGQDPYHHPGQAHGLSFSVPIGIPPPPSLLNIYKELERDEDVKGFKRPGHGYLIGWARQGVLMLNAVLTVQSRKPNSHKDQGWEKLTDAVIKHLNSENNGIIFLLWGAYAQKKADFVDKKKHHILKSVHPSPLSASKGFIGCNHFSQCNKLLEQQGKSPIDWTHLPTN